MPHRRLSAGTCEVVPLEDEPRCPERGFGDRPRLCMSHRKEYARLTAAYKATSEEAIELYDRVRAQDWDDDALWNMPAVEKALGVAGRCVEVINREIRERQEHHRRFFVELHDGHEAWIKRLRKKLREVEDVLAQLRRCETLLVDDERQRAEELRLAEAWLAEEQRLAEAQRKRDAARRSQYNSSWTAAAHSGCRCHPSTKTGYTPPKAARPACIAYHAHNSLYGHVRCTKEGLYSALRCQEHQDEHTAALSALRAAESEYSNLTTTIYYARERRAPTLSQVMTDIADLTRYLALMDSITALSDKLARLDGYSTTAGSYRKADMAAWGLNRNVVQSLLNMRRVSRSELLWPEPAAAAPTPSYGRAAQASHQEQPQPAAPAQKPQPPPEEESSGWVGVVLTAAAVGIAALFGFRR